MSAVDIFEQSRQTFEEAKKKIADETVSRSKHFRMQKDGTYCVRILPLAPALDKEGKVLPMERKGYEYPIRNTVLKITGHDSKGKEKQVFVGVCNTGYAFPELKCDLIDTYVLVATDLYADDEAVVKKIKENSFSGGLKWNSGRQMYILDVDKREEGIQILELSFSQYKELEDRKMQVWEKLLKKTDQAPCPISSIDSAYFVEIIRKTENKKVGYTFNIDTLSDPDSLTEKELQALLDAPRLPEVIYRYSRFHLEATIAFLNQYDEKLEIDVMSDERIADCIDKIKMALPSNDTSHFSFDGTTESSSQSQNSGIDSLWDMYDELEEKKLGDKSEEGQDLRADIKKFIEDTGLDIVVSRSKTNRDLLEEIEEVLGKEENNPESPEEKNEQDYPESEEDKEPFPPTSERRSGRSENTGESATQTGRRSSRRPERRRR